MSNAVGNFVIPRLKWLLPVTVVSGTLIFMLGYKIYYAKPAKRRKYQRNEDHANHLWEMVHSQEGQLGQKS